MRGGKKQRSEDDFEVLEQGKPFIRGILAFIGYLRFGKGIGVGRQSIEHHYQTADIFIKQLEEDMKE